MGATTTTVLEDIIAVKKKTDDCVAQYTLQVNINGCHERLVVRYGGMVHKSKYIVLYPIHHACCFLLYGTVPH